MSHIRKAIRVDMENYKEKVAGCIVSLHEKTRPGNTLPEQQKVDVNEEAKKAVNQLQSHSSKQVDGTIFKSQYQNDDLKRVLMVFPSSEWKTLEQKVSKEIQILVE